MMSSFNDVSTILTLLLDPVETIPDFLDGVFAVMAVTVS